MYHVLIPLLADEKMWEMEKALKILILTICFLYLEPETKGTPLIDSIGVSTSACCCLGLVRNIKAKLCQKESGIMKAN